MIGIKIDFSKLCIKTFASCSLCIILYPFTVKGSNAELKENTVPRLHELDMIECNGKKLKVIESAASKWEKLAIHLKFDSSRISSIGWNSQFKTKDACMSVLSEWLGGVKGSRQPTTWATLVKVLEEADLGDLSKELKSVLD